MPTLTIDDQEITVEPGTTIIQACEQLGIEIPRFCYHERLSIAGNCRMCLVEVSPGPPKPAASCAMPCGDKMVVKTNSPMVKKAREGVMEFLLINHPLDCPICDQGGECDLQDQAMFYGSGTSRYDEHKRSVEDKYMGPLIKTHMTRCIHCTRCIRFASDVAGVPELGATGRGEHMEVTTYIEQAIHSELSGNVIDLCPVGALTSRPYAFNARPWELTKTETIDVMDAVGSNIRVDSRAGAVLRVLPRIHEDVNEEWISDKTRYACDGLKLQRLDRPYVRGSNGTLAEASWEEAFSVIAEKMQDIMPSEMAALAGNLVDVESVYALKMLMQSLGVVNIDCRQEGAQLPYASRSDYVFNSTIAGIDEADCIVLIGTHPRWEAPLINARIRRAWVERGIPVYVIGEPYELTYPYTHIDVSPLVLNHILAGDSPLISALSNASRPMMIVGTGALARPDGGAIYQAAQAVAEKCNVVREHWNGFNIVHHAAGRVGALDVGFVPTEDGRDIASIVQAAGQGDIKLVYLLGADEMDMALFGDAFIIYQGHHGDDGAARADVVLPGAAYTEKDATYVNTEGRVQLARRAVFPPGKAKEDWAIIRALSEKLEHTLPFNSLDALRAQLYEEVPHMALVNEIVTGEWQSPKNKRDRYLIDDARFEPLITNFYMTDPISRVSKTMAECTRLVLAEQMPAREVA